MRTAFVQSHPKSFASASESSGMQTTLGRKAGNRRASLHARTLEKIFSPASTAHVSSGLPALPMCNHVELGSNHQLVAPRRSSYCTARLPQFASKRVLQRRMSAMSFSVYSGSRQEHHLGDEVAHVKRQPRYTGIETKPASLARSLRSDTLDPALVVALREHGCCKFRTRAMTRRKKQ